MPLDRQHDRRAEDFGTAGNASGQTGTSIFDPVLCEIAYRWFCPPGGLVLDPFAGGSVRGIVASQLGRRYVGVDLSERQIEANRVQAKAICSDPAPEWVVGDSRTALPDVAADMIFSCPPYADLEVYSDDPRDLSTMDYAGFRAAYREIVAASSARLVADSFAVFVVGEVRDKKGHYVDLVGDTVEAFRAAGLEFYNEAILVTAVGSLPIRAGKQFSASRKLGKTHQNVLVFLKGDGKRTAVRCGPVEVSLGIASPTGTQRGHQPRLGTYAARRATPCCATPKPAP
jgi:DNA modification methylase